MSKVYFMRVKEDENLGSRAIRLSRLLDKALAFDLLKKDDEVAVKVHFGEDGNTGYIKPQLTKVVVDNILKRGARANVADSNVLYKGRRTFTKDHLILASEHGYTKDAVGAPVVIAEGEGGKDITEVNIGLKHIKKAYIASLFCRADSIVGVSHFKGHLLTGFGGTLKNIGMGCASREGKLAQHSNMAPLVNAETCIGCGTCAPECPSHAISVSNEKARVDPESCVGCAECISVCPSKAINVDWGSGAEDIQEKMAEYALAVLKGKEPGSVFINFATQVSSECDCWTKDYPVIAPDVGIFVSLDPVSVDKASRDAVVASCGRDVFKEAHPEIDGSKQLKHASLIGLGSMDYELIEIS